MFPINVPNILTMLRILLVPVLVAALLSEGPYGDVLGAGVFVLASFTDALDGWIARRSRQESNFGKLLDPLADKLLIAAALVSLVSLDRVAAWVAMVIIAREFAVTGLRLVAIEHGHVIPASIWGKGKTVAQIIMVLALIIVGRHGGSSAVWLQVIVYSTVVITVMSGADYFFGLRRMLTESKQNAQQKVDARRSSSDASDSNST
jgi:CDP-diacylglycerol---glycerol-3-phosphate 3-phosphatidyltransferase